MEKIFKSLFTIFIVLCSTAAFAEKNTSMAILDFDTVGVETKIGKAVSDIITTEISNKKEIRIIERTQIGVIIEEQGFQKSGCAESSCAVKIGKMLSANKILIGSVVKMGEKYIITGKVVDVETGQLDYSENEGCFKEEDIENASKIVALKLLNKITGKSYSVSDIREAGDEERNRFSVGVMGIWGKMPEISVVELKDKYDKTKTISQNFRGINFSTGYDLTDYFTVKLGGSYFYVYDISIETNYDYETPAPTVRCANYPKNAKKIDGYNYSIDFQLNRSLKHFTTFLNVGIGNNFTKVDNDIRRSIEYMDSSYSILFDRKVYYDLMLNEYNIFGKVGAGVSIKVISNIDFTVEFGTKYVFYEKTKTKINKTNDKIDNYQSVPNAEALSQQYVVAEGTYENSRRNFFSEYSVSAGFLFRIF